MINTIIFDLGGVLYDIDVSLTGKAFTQMGVPDIQELHRSISEGHTYEGLDTGCISPAMFRDSIRSITGAPLSDAQVDHAWNALLVSFPHHRVKLLQGLRANYRILLLSNTNAIHYDCYTARFQQEYGFAFESLFDKAYYSYRLGLRKPDPAIFRHVINESSLVPEHAVFIDDVIENIESARATGLRAIHLTSQEDVTGLFDNFRLKSQYL